MKISVRILCIVTSVDKLLNRIVLRDNIRDKEQRRDHLLNCGVGLVIKAAVKSELSAIDPGLVNCLAVQDCLSQIKCNDCFVCHCLVDGHGLKSIHQILQVCFITILASDQDRVLSSIVRLDGLRYAKSGGVVRAECHIQLCSIRIVGAQDVLHSGKGLLCIPLSRCDRIEIGLSGRNLQCSLVQIRLKDIHSALIEVAGVVVTGVTGCDLKVERAFRVLKIKSIDTSEAEKMPGVYKIVTAKDVKAVGCDNRVAFFSFSPRTLATEKSHFVIAEDKIMNYGDCIAVAVADTKQHAREAAAKVTFEYEQLPEYRNYLDAVKPDAIRIHDDHPNMWCIQPTIKGAGHDIDKLFDEAPYVVEGSFYSPREPHGQIESDTIQAYFSADGMLCVHCKAMAIGAHLADIAEATGIPQEKIRVIANPTGASFGWSTNAGDLALAGTAVVCTGEPCALHMSYEEHQAFSGKRCPCYSNGRAACDENGKIVLSAKAILENGEVRLALDREAEGAAFEVVLPDGSRRHAKVEGKTACIRL